MLDAISNIGGVPDNPTHTQYNDQGIVVWWEHEFKGRKRCRATFVEWGKSERVQWCGVCNDAYSGHSPQPCFACAVGLK
jgi:hypothetical protein